MLAAAAFCGCAFGSSAASAGELCSFAQVTGGQLATAFFEGKCSDGDTIVFQLNESRWQSAYLVGEFCDLRHNVVIFRDPESGWLNITCIADWKRKAKAGG